MTKNTVTLEMSVNASFSLKVPKTNQATFKKDLKRGALCINWHVRYGNKTKYMGLSSRKFSKGGLKIGKFSGETCQIDFSGKVSRELDPNFFEDLMQALNKAGSLPLILYYISTDEGEFYKDGDESAIVDCGTARLV